MVSCSPGTRCADPPLNRRWSNVCSVRARERDHVLAHARGGATDCTNQCRLCRSHHRLKTFAPGWRFTIDDDGTLHVTTPSGVTRTTRPPGSRPPARPPEPPPGPEPPPAPPADDDAPPF